MMSGIYDLITLSWILVLLTLDCSLLGEIFCALVNFWENGRCLAHYVVQYCIPGIKDADWNQINHFLWL